MTDRTALVRLAKLVAKDVAGGRPGENSWTATHFLDGVPDAALGLIDLLVAERKKRRANGHLISAYTYLFGHALESIRYGVEGGHAEAAKIADEIRAKLLELGSSEVTEPALMLLLLSQFAVAKLDPGQGLRATMSDLMEAAGASMPTGVRDEDIASYIADLAAEVEGDPFALHERLRELTEPLPDGHRASVGVSMIVSEIPAAREAAVGWLFDATAEVRDAVAAAVGQAASAGGVSGTMLRRMITLRNWLPEASRPALDQAIQACRRKGVECAPWPETQIRDVLATMIDGAGAQSVFVICREGRRSALGSLLVKHGIGVRDSWVRHKLTRAEMDEFFGMAVAEMGLLPVDPRYAEVAATHFLAVNLAAGVMPPFGLLDFLETGGQARIQPDALTAERVLAMMADDVDPGWLGEAGIKRILAEGTYLADEYPFLDSWFEDDDEVQRLLSGKRMARSKRVATVLEDLLPGRRAKWADLLAWTALTLHLCEDEERWLDFFIGAKVVADGGMPMKAIPLMRHVAEQTVDAVAARSAAR